MPMDGVFLNKLVKEIVPKITNGKIRKINQIGKHDVIFSIRCNGENLNLFISVNSTYGTINFTNNKYETPKTNFMFCTILKKYILNGTIKEVSQIENDRILKLIIDNRNELGDMETFNLIIELMGKHSNISLINESNQKVLDSIKHLSSTNNSYRTLIPGSIYKYPPKDDLKMNPFDFTFDNFKKVMNVIDIDENMYSKIFQGVSTPLSKFIFTQTENHSIKDKFSIINEIFKSNINPILYMTNESYKDFYCFDINSYEKKVQFNNLNELLDDFIVNKNKFDTLNNKILNIKKVINSVIQKTSKKISIFEKSLKESENKDIYKLYGDLISSNIYMLKGGEDSITVQNYFSENLEEIKIKLNPKLHASQNIENYYKKYKKLKKSEIMNQNNIIESTKEIEYLNSVLNSLDKIENENDIDEIREELTNSGYLKNIRTKNKQEIIKSKPYHYITSSGVSIFVGKNNIQNESLTFKIAKKDYTWFHTKNIPGSHVILAHNNPDDKLIEIAGKLAAFYSKASTSSNVPIDYTKVKNIKKMPHAKPGMVIYSSNNTVYITPPSSINELNLILNND